jgi:hypothetical protein
VNRPLTKPERGTPMGVELTRRIMRHVVGIYYDFTLEGERRQVVQTAFLFSVAGRWMLMTAGHCISDIRAFRDRGGILRRCRLIDCMGEGAEHVEPVPLSYDDASPLPLGIREHIDYGVLFPPDNACHLLAANNLVPFDEDAWNEEPGEARDYFLLGFPDQLNAYRGNLINVRASMMRLRRYAERPEDFPEEDPPGMFFYGRAIEQPLNSLRGFSGGPIVSMSHPDQDGTAHYYLVALQSTSMGDDVKGMLMRPLGELVREILSRRQE